jgi:hypothetical protein
MSKQSREMVGSALCTAILADLGDPCMWLLPEHLKQISAAVRKAEKRWADGVIPSDEQPHKFKPNLVTLPSDAATTAPGEVGHQAVVRGEKKAAGKKKAGPRRVRVNGEIYGNMTAAFIALGLHKKGDPTRELDKFRGECNKAGSGEFSGYKFEVVQ